MPRTGQRKPTREGRLHEARFALLPALFCAGLWVAPAALEAAVVVVQNRSDQAVAFHLEPVWGERREYSLAPGKLVQVQVPDSVEMTFTLGAGPVSRWIDPNSVHCFVKKGEKVVLEQVGFSQTRSSRWWVADGRKEPPATVVAPVIILVDEEQTAARDEWEARLRAQLAAASGAIEAHCGVRFEVVGVETWESDDDQSDFARLEGAFRQAVAGDHAWLAIGVTSQFRISEKHPLPHVGRRAFFTHLLLPDVQDGFSDTDQLDLLTHELGHFLGAVHSPDDDSVMRSPVHDEKVERGPSGLGFDAASTLAMNLIADEIRLNEARRLSQIERGTRGALLAIYQEMARQVRKDSQAARAVEWLRESASGGLRYTGQWTDAVRRSGDEVGPWHQPGSRPALAGRPLFEGDRPIRWLLDNSLSPAAPPRAMVEFVGGDRLPGRVVAVASGEETPTDQTPPHLVVAPYVPLDWPSAPARPRIRVTTDWVRRIVWKWATDRYQPRTLFLRDGRRLDFRSVRLTETSVRLLQEEGIREVSLGDVAELHFPPLDPWEAYFGQLSVLSPAGGSRLVELETAGGLRATSSSERSQPGSYGSQEDPANWYQRIQPAWSLDPFWLRHRAIRWRRYFMPHEVPLSRMDPAEVRQESDLGTAWRWQVDRNVKGGPLRSGGLVHLWGFGVHATNELAFSLPACARAFRTRLGLDELAGDGGCAVASVFLGSTAAKPLFAGSILSGSAKVLDSGRLAIDTSSQAAGRLVLQVDAAHRGRPAGADPFDVRDTFDWLEPIVELAPLQLQAEVFRRGPERMPAWRNWRVTTGDKEGAVLANHWDQTDSRQPVHRLLAAARDSPLKLSRTFLVPPDRDRLLLSVSRPPTTAPGKIEVHVGGQPVAELEVPVRRSHEAPEPLVVSLLEHQGREITIDLIHKPQADVTLIEWRGITLAGAPEE